jgi:enoyl-CoA hydratase
LLSLSHSQACCDFRFASSKSIFAMPEVQLGIPSVVQARMLANIIGWQRTRELGDNAVLPSNLCSADFDAVLVGDTIDTETALSWGLVDRVSRNTNTSMLTTLKFARKLLANGPEAMKIQKRLIRHWEETDINAGVEEGIDAFASAYSDGGLEPKRMMAAWNSRWRTQKRALLRKQTGSPSSDTDDADEAHRERVNHEQQSELAKRKLLKRSGTMVVSN